jgi:alkanesulfonate monooxygenase SsuD/methylene tetrahydromethanopterin reductase-like flavin-dependent oxidoreductase (luciferase family)
MDVGIQVIFSAFGSDAPDSQVYSEEIRLCLLAEDLGYDVIWPVEHHFNDYSFCPDNMQFLSYLAGRTSTIGLGTAAVILPWNEPLRVAEKIALLDELSGGRVRFGMGRGLSRREYEPFRDIEMDESRGRFDEAAPMILEALETGFIEGSGAFYPQTRTELRPRPTRTFKGRTYAVANSADSVEIAAKIGARMIMFAERSWDSRMVGIQRYRDQYKVHHGAEAPPVLTCDFIYCDENAARGEELANQYLGSYLGSLLDHYELMGEHFSKLVGYEGYGKNAEMMRAIGESGFLKGFKAANAYGTPDQILRSLESRYKVLGTFEQSTSFRFGGISYEHAEKSMRLFAKEVLPVLKTWE